MQHSEDLERLRVRNVDDEIREHSIKENLLPGQIRTPVPTVRDIRQSVEAFEEFGYNAIRVIYARPLQKVKPNSIDIDDGIVSKLKCVHHRMAALLALREMRVSQRTQFLPGFVWTIHSTGGNLFQRMLDLFIQSVAFFLGPALFGVQGFESAAKHVFDICVTAA
jgi:hypothetical protein